MQAGDLVAVTIVGVADGAGGMQRPMHFGLHRRRVGLRRHLQPVVPRALWCSHAPRTRGVFPSSALHGGRCAVGRAGACAHICQHTVHLVAEHQPQVTLDQLRGHFEYSCHKQRQQPDVGKCPAVGTVAKDSIRFVFD